MLGVDVGVDVGEALMSALVTALALASAKVSLLASELTSGVEVESDALGARAGGSGVTHSRRDDGYGEKEAKVDCGRLRKWIGG